MSGAATRWRLLELQRLRRAVDGGIGLLDRKREALLRALTERREAVARTRRQLAAAHGRARAAVARALVEIGGAANLAASLAQPPHAAVGVSDESVLGVRVPRLAAGFEAFRPRYAPGGTCVSTDEAGAAYVALLEGLLRVAEQESAERNLTRGLRRTTRTLNALKRVLLPAIDADIRGVAGGLDEEEREEATRWRGRRV